MGFLDTIKKAGSDVVKGISKTIDKAIIDNKATNEAYQIKRTILLNLSITELKNMAHLLGLDSLEYSQYFDEKEMTMKEKKIKLDKFDYVDNLAKKPSSELVLKLRHLRKSSLADEMEREIGFIEAKLREQKDAITKEVSKDDQEKGKDIILSVYVSKIVDEIITINPEKAKNERDYQIELKGFLKSSIKKEFPKQKVSVEVEYATKTGKRIDIMILIDNYKIGIETKYDLCSSGKGQRARGQLLEYSKFLDGLILVQYSPLDNKVELDNLKDLNKILPIPFKVIANGNLKI